MSAELGNTNSQRSKASKEQQKDSQRGSRFSNPMGIKKGSEALVEQRLKEELSEMALKVCRSEQKIFADCAKKWNMGVVFMCRSENENMNKCIRQYTNDKALASYKKSKNKKKVR
jgi:hypothetical protein